MPSRLYRNAVASLSTAERKTLTAFQARLKSHPPAATDGPKLVANFKKEAHLVGDKAFGNPTELTLFLRLCLKGRARARRPAATVDAYCSACERFELRGLAIPRDRLPTNLLRYSSSRKLLAAVLERQLGRAARRAFDGGTMTPEDAFSRLSVKWDRSRLSPAERLAKGKAVFATFEHKAGAPRNDARTMAEALALRIVGADPVMFEFSYPRDSVENHRFPTVADAGPHDLFEPAAETEPDPAVPETCWGWTKPLGAQPPQPEIVHANAPLRILSGPPRFVGRITT